MSYPNKYATAVSISTNDTNRIIEIQIGESTHHHDQSIVLVSFRITNTISTTVEHPILPPLEDELFDDMFFSFD